MAIKKLPSTGDMPRSTGVPESLVAGGAADSAGFPWEGRDFDHHGTAFADDDGETPAALSAAVAAVRECAVVLRSSGAEADIAALANANADVVIALATSRVLIPLIAEAGDTGLTPEGKIVEKSQELSIVTLAGPDGRHVMPVFTSTAAMQAWDPTARPIPVPGPQAALAAAQERTDLIIVDPGSQSQEFGVRRTQLEAMATGERVLPAWADAAVIDAFRDAAQDQPAVEGITLLPADPEARLRAPEVDVVLHLAPGLDEAGLRSVLAILQQRWTASPVIATRVDSLRLRPVAAE